MNEADRLARNGDRWAECDTGFANHGRRVFRKLEAIGLRPRINTAFRSLDEQRELFEAGFSKTLFGFHNVTRQSGWYESMAVDVIDDDAPLAPQRRFLLALAIFANDVDLETGISWGLTRSDRQLMTTAILNKDMDSTVAFGWDPGHLQPATVTIDEARNGRRLTLLADPAEDNGSAIPVPELPQPVGRRYWSILEFLRIFFRVRSR